MRSRRSRLPPISLANKLTILVIVLAVLVPVFFLPLAWVSVVQSKILLVATIMIAATCVWGWNSYRSDLIAPRINAVTVAALSLALAYTFSALLSGVGSTGFIEGSGTSITVALAWMLAGIVILPSLAFEEPSRGRIVVLRSLTLGALALSAVQLFHLLAPGIALGPLIAPAQSALGFWQAYGTFAGLCVVLSLLLVGSEEFSRPWDIALAALGILSAFMLFIVDIAAIWYMLALVLALTSVVLWLRYSRNRFGTIQGSRAMFVAACAVLSALCGIGSTLIYTHLPAHLQVLQVDVRPSWSASFDIAMHEYASLRRALVGSGPGTFANAWHLYKSDSVNASPYWNTVFPSGTGTIPTALITLGLLGSAAWIALIIAAAYTAWRRLMEREASLALLATACSVAYLFVAHVISVVDFGLTAVLFLLLGTLALVDVDVRGSFVRLERPAVLVLVCIGVLAIALASLYEVRASVSQVIAQRAVVRFQAGESESSLGELSLALRLYPQNDDADRAAAQIELSEIGELAAASGTPQAVLQGAVSSAVAHMLDATRINGSSYDTWMLDGSLYALLDELGVQSAKTSATMAYERAHELDPQNPEPLLALAQIAYETHDTSEANRRLAAALALKPDYLPAVLFRAQIELDARDYTAAEADATMLTQRAPNDPASWYALGVLYIAEGAYTRAIPPLQQSYELQGPNGSAAYELGLAYDGAGERDAALSIFQQLAHALPQNGALAQIVDNIETGRPALQAATSSTLTASSTPIR